MQPTQPTHLESSFFCAEHGQRIHELHMARSTLVQLDSIDRVPPQRLRCTIGSPCCSNPDFNIGGVRNGLGPPLSLNAGPSVAHDDL